MFSVSYHYLFLGPESVFQDIRQNCPLSNTYIFLHAYVLMPCKHKYLDFCEILIVVLQVLLMLISLR